MRRCDWVLGVAVTAGSSEEGSGSSVEVAGPASIA